MLVSKTRLSMCLKKKNIYIYIYIYSISQKYTPLTFQQNIFYIFSRDNTAEMKLGYILE